MSTAELDIHSLLRNHRSIRRYSSEPVSELLLEKILRSGIQASSSGNMQPFSIVVTSDPELRRALHPIHFAQDQVLEAPLLLTFCADFRRMRRWLELSEAPPNFDNPMSFLIGAIDAVLVSQNVAIAAEAEGLGLCYLGTTLANCREVAKILKLPANVFPVVGFTLGFPAETPECRDRLPLRGLVHRETYQEISDEDVLALYEQRETNGMRRYLANSELRERAHAVGAKNLAQVYTMVKYTRESHLHYSETVMQTLREQNFFNMV
jgi:nitroreductase